MTLHTKTLAGVPSVSLIESPSAGIQVENQGSVNDPSYKSYRQSYHDCHYRHIMDCISRTELNNLMTCNLTEIFKRIEVWRTQLPRVVPFYAVKCNTDLPVLKILAASGVNFDCASKLEIETILRQVDSDPSRIIFANPCKFKRDIKYAYESGVKRTTFDNELELDKIARDWPTAECLLRILPERYEAQCILSDKFGAPLDIVPSLLSKAAKLKLKIVGISFHVGSGCYEAKAWADSVRMAKRVADTFHEYGFTMKVLDIGGGFPGNSAETRQDDQPAFTDICHYLRGALDQEFPEGSGVEIIAEPGRYFASSLYTAVTHIYAEKTVNENGEVIKCVFAGDGVYGTFNNIIFDHQKVQLAAIISPAGQSSMTEEVKISSSGDDLKQDIRDHLMDRTNKDESRQLNDDANDKINLRCPLDLSPFNRLEPQTRKKHLSKSQKKNKAKCTIKQISQDNHIDDIQPTIKTKIFGPTCDGLDSLTLGAFPDFGYGDWLVWPDMGAYTISAASRFNGMPLPEIFYFLYDPSEQQLAVVRNALGLGEPLEDNP